MNQHSVLPRYQEQAVRTMTAQELLGVVLDELVRRLYLARQSLMQADFDLFEASVRRAIEIYGYLCLTLNRSIPLSAELYELYRVQTQLLCRVLAGRSPDRMEEAVSLAKELRDTFETAEKQSRESLGGGERGAS